MYSFYVWSVWISYLVPALLLLALLYQGAARAEAKWHLAKVSLPELEWLVLKVILGACIFFFLVRGVASFLSVRQLRADARSMSAELISFGEDRQKQMPSTDARDWDQYMRTMARVSGEARHDYAQRYAARVALLRQEFARRGLSDSTLDSFYADPRDPLAVRTVGERLSLLAQILH